MGFVRLRIIICVMLSWLNYSKLHCTPIQYRLSQANRSMCANVRLINCSGLYIVQCPHTARNTLNRRSVFYYIVSREVGELSG